MAAVLKGGQDDTTTTNVKGKKVNNDHQNK
jgi:hypothetical protein